MRKLKMDGTPGIILLLSFSINKGLAVKCYAEGELARDCPNPEDICYTKQAADHAEDNLKSRGCTSLALVERTFGKNFEINSCFQPRAGTFDCWCDQDKCNESKETACQTCAANQLIQISSFFLFLATARIFLWFYLKPTYIFNSHFFLSFFFFFFFLGGGGVVAIEKGYLLKKSNK